MAWLDRSNIEANWSHHCRLCSCTVPDVVSPSPNERPREEFASDTDSRICVNSGQSLQPTKRLPFSRFLLGRFRCNLLLYRYVCGFNPGQAGINRPGWSHAPMGANFMLFLGYGFGRNGCSHWFSPLRKRKGGRMVRFYAAGFYFSHLVEARADQFVKEVNGSSLAETQSTVSVVPLRKSHIVG
jgi:hypothetical protein